MNITKDQFKVLKDYIIDEVETYKELRTELPVELKDAYQVIKTLEVH